MSYLKIYEALNSQFAKISEVNYLIKQKDLHCLERLKNWLSSTEKLLNAFNFNESAQMASYRGQLIVAELASDRKIPRKKREINAALEVVEPAKNTMINVISPLETRIRESEKIIQELLEEQLELNLYAWNNGLNYRDFIQAVWRTLLKQANTRQRANKVKALVGEEDALKLIADQIKIN